jgi:hypothetical protein
MALIISGVAGRWVVPDVVSEAMARPSSGQPTGGFTVGLSMAPFSTPQFARTFS